MKLIRYEFVKLLKQKNLLIKGQVHNQKSIADKLGISLSKVSRLHDKYEITGSLEHLGGLGLQIKLTTEVK